MIITTEEADTISARLRAIDHMSVEDCFLQSHLYTEAADTIDALVAALEGAGGDNADQPNEALKARASRRAPRCLNRR